MADTPQAIAQEGNSSVRRPTVARRRSRESLRRRDENSAAPGRNKVRGTEEAGGHRVGHVRAAGARDGRGVRVQGGAGGAAHGLAGAVAGRRAAAGPRQVRHPRRRRLLPRPLGVRAGGRRRGRLRAVVPGPARIATYLCPLVLCCRCACVVPTSKGRKVLAEINHHHLVVRCPR